MPPGEGKDVYIREVFSGIARRYDLMNTLLSLNRDAYWRRVAVEKSGLTAGGRALDVCCGTGKLTLELARVATGSGGVTGLDFCEDMLTIARKRTYSSPYRGAVTLIRGDALALPYEENSFDCATIGFALRNVNDIKTVLKEMKRVVRPGGRVVNLELAKPSLPGFKQIYYFYFEHLIPVLGKLGSGREGPYSYLPRSLKDFPHQLGIKRLFEEIGLHQVSCDELTGGIVAVHVGVKP